MVNSWLDSGPSTAGGLTEDDIKELDAKFPPLPAPGSAEVMMLVGGDSLLLRVSPSR
jgi:hypothetical protein